MGVNRSKFNFIRTHSCCISNKRESRYSSMVANICLQTPTYPPAPDPGVGFKGLNSKRSGKSLFWSIKHSSEILDKLKARDFNVTSLSTYDSSTLYTTSPHNLIKDTLIDLIERTFQREGSPFLACYDRNAFYFRKS